MCWFLVNRPLPTAEVDSARQSAAACGRSCRPLYHLVATRLREGIATLGLFTLGLRLDRSRVPSAAVTRDISALRAEADRRRALALEQRERFRRDLACRGTRARDRIASISRALLVGVRIHLRHVLCLRRKRELHAEALGQAQDVEVQAMALALLRGPIRHLEEDLELDIERARAELLQPHVVLVLARVRMAADQLADALAKGVDLLRRRVVRHPERRARPPVAAQAAIFHVRGDEAAVGHRDRKSTRLNSSHLVI